MSFNKTKSMRNAERYLTQGRIEAAISEYRQIVDHDPKDIGNQNMLGDLYFKTNNVEFAVECYRKVADHYYDQGFAKKAIAVYNKIHKLDPSLTHIIGKLAELYQLRGSHAEARNHFELYAERLEKDGKDIEVLEVWERLAEIDPGNADICVKIAESHSGRGKKDEACKAYFEAGTRLAEKGKHKEASEAFASAIDLNDHFWKAVRGMVRSKILLGEAREAADLLEDRLVEDPYNKEFTYLLIDCYFELDDAAAAEKVITKLVEREPANYPKLLDLVKVYIKNNSPESAVRVISMLSEHLLAGGDAKTLETHLQQVLDSDPGNVDGMRLLARCYGWRKEQEKLKETLKRMASAANEQGRPTDERWALAQFLYLVPHDSERARRFEELEEKYGRERRDGEDLGLGTESASPERTAGEFGLESEAEFASVNGEGSGLIAFGGEAPSGFVPATVVEEPGTVTVIADDVTVVAETGSPNGSHEPNESQEYVTTSLGPADELHLDEEIESIKFYIEQGYDSLADKALSALESQFGNREAIVSLRAELGGAQDRVSAFTNGEMKRAEAMTAIAQEKQVQVEPEAEPEPKTESGSENFSDPLSEIASDLGLDESEEPDEGDFEEHFNSGVAYKEMGLTEEAIREFQHAAECAGDGDPGRRYYNCCTMLGFCFVETGMPKLALIWFERALQCKGLTDEERQALEYEIGNVHEIAGDAEQAVEHFERVYALDIDFRDVGQRLESLREQLPVGA